MNEPLRIDRAAKAARDISELPDCPTPQRAGTSAELCLKQRISCLKNVIFKKNGYAAHGTVLGKTYLKPSNQFLHPITDFHIWRSEDIPQPQPSMPIWTQIRYILGKKFTEEMEERGSSYQ